MIVEHEILELLFSILHIACVSVTRVHVIVVKAEF